MSSATGSRKTCTMANPGPFRQTANPGPFRQYLIHSYLYYVQDSPVISDGEYDELCKALLGLLEDGYVPENHGYADQSALAAGSGFHIPADRYPGIVVSVARDLMKTPWKPHDIYPHEYCRCGSCRGAVLDDSCIDMAFLFL